MIPNSVEDILEKQERTQRKHRVLTASAIGAGLAVAVSMFALKHDINKTYFDLSKRIDAVEAQVQHYTSLPVVASDTTPTNMNVHIHLHAQAEYALVEPCTIFRNGAYEVRPC